MFDRKAYMKEYNKKNSNWSNPATREAHRRYQRRKKYGVEDDEYQAMLTSQNGACAICQALPNGKPLGVDHDSLTGVVRGLLCDNCNRAIGLLKHDPKLLKVAAAYLEINREEEEARELN